MEKEQRDRAEQEVERLRKEKKSREEAERVRRQKWSDEKKKAKQMNADISHHINEFGHEKLLEIMQ